MVNIAFFSIAGENRFCIDCYLHSSGLAISIL